MASVTAWAPGTVAAGRVESRGARTEIHRTGAVEWFDNGPAGLEHGLRLSQRAAGTGELVLAFAVGHSRARLEEDRVVFETPGGRSLDYGALHVFDARGDPLPARFAVPTPERVELRIDDAGAAYPLDVDPLLTATHRGWCSR